jgi:DNA-binding CsgD family transcriptional regulator
MRIIYDAAVLDSDHNRTLLSRRISSGAQVRIRPGPLQRLIIMDEQVAVTQADPLDTQRGAVVVRQSGLLNGLREMFRLAWDSARDVQPDEVAPPPLTQDERVVLDLLAAGRTDEQAARTAGISVRHFRRRVARLMGELHAGSRFQAGAVAAQRGWI